MTISIIIPTYNRSHLLKNVLDSLNNQTIVEFEVIVSSDGSTDNSFEVLNELKPLYSFYINYLDNLHGGRAKCRNLGAKASKGDILIFYDDDVRVNPKSVETHYLHHKNYPNSICIGPAYYEMGKLKNDFQKFRAQMEHSWYPKKCSMSRKAGMPGANWSISKENFFNIGALNETLLDSEDFEFSYRATQFYNLPIFFNPDTWVYHDDYKSLHQYLQRYIIGNKSLANLFEQDYSIKRDYWKKLYIKRSTFKTFFFRLFNTKSSIKFVESRLFLKLPRRFRYKFYDFVITAQTRYFLNENFNSCKAD